MSPSTHYRSLRRRVFPVNHLHWYWQPNKNNQETEHTNKTTQKWALAQHTLKKSRLRGRTDRAWFSHLVWHPARKRSRSVLTYVCMYSLMSHSTQYRSFRRRGEGWAVMCISHSIMEGQRHNNPLNPRCFVYNGPKGMELAPNPCYSGGS